MTNTTMRSFLLAAILFLPLSLLAQSSDPEADKKSFTVAPGFEVQLFAANPEMSKPIAMNFDYKGRLWVACSESYPQLKPGEEPIDKVFVIDQKDGKLIKIKEEAGRLLMPTGIEFYKNTPITANSTELLRGSYGGSTILSGFGTEDTHHLLHTLRFGPDGWLYMNQSVYIHSHIETPFGTQRLNGGGVWRYHVEKKKLEVVARGFWNPWGTTWDRYGQCFITDGAFFEGVNLLVPGAYYAGTPYTSKVLPGMNPGSPKYCGAEIVTGSHLPDDWQGNLITNDFRGHRVCRYVLKEEGAGYVAVEQQEVIKTNNPNFRPIDVKQGPDGAIYIADWYNPIINHGEVDFRDPRRDKLQGRIWRVIAKDRPLVPAVKLDSGILSDVFTKLESPEGWVRHQARRALTTFSEQQVLSHLREKFAEAKRSGAKNEELLLEWLWVSQTMGRIDSELLSLCLAAKDGRIRAAAVRAWRDDLLPGSTFQVEQLKKYISDPHPRVRLETLRALSLLKLPEAVSVGLRVLDQPMDRYLDYAVTLTLDEHEAMLKAALKADQWTLPLPHLLHAARATRWTEWVPKLLAASKATDVKLTDKTRLSQLIGELGSSNDLQAIWDQITSSNQESAERIAYLQAFETAALKRNVVPGKSKEKLLPFLDGKDDELTLSALRLAKAWKLKEAAPKVIRQIESSSLPEPVRSLAMEALPQLGSPDARNVLKKLAEGKESFTLRQKAVLSLATLDLNSAATLGVSLCEKLQREDDPTPMLSSLLTLPNGSKALTSELANRQLPTDAAKVMKRIVQSTGRPAAELIATIEKSGKLSATKKEWTKPEIDSIVKLAREKGDPHRGEKVFRRSDMACLKCHAIAGAGGEVGPDLTTIGTSAPPDYLVESMLLPNKAIKENYHTLVVETKDGKFTSGVKVRESTEEVVLRDAENKLLTLAKKNITESSQGKSLMPESLLEPLTEAEQYDLVRFIMELGKAAEFSIGREKPARVWEVLQPSAALGGLFVRERQSIVTTNHPQLQWSVAYSQVKGDLPLAELPVIQNRRPGHDLTDRFSIVRYNFEVTSETKSTLQLPKWEDVTVWLDDGILTKDKSEVTLKPGKHRVTIIIDRQKKNDAIRLEWSDVSKMR